jgi:hypothetical protein
VSINPDKTYVGEEENKKDDEFEEMDMMDINEKEN